MLFADYFFHRSRVCVSGFDLITFETNKKKKNNDSEEEDSRTRQTRGGILVAACKQVDPPPGRHLAPRVSVVNRVP